MFHACYPGGPVPADVAAQTAVVSDRLRGVLGASSEENEAAPSNSPIQVAVPAPRLAQGHQSVSTTREGLGRENASAQKVRKAPLSAAAGNTLLLLSPLSCPAQTIPVF